MKKIAIVTLFLTFNLHGFAQKKNSFIEKKVKQVTEFIVTEMAFNGEQKVNLHLILLEGYVSNKEKIKGKNLSKEEKKKIRKASFRRMKDKLLAKFTKKEVKKINKLHRDWSKKNRK